MSTEERTSVARTPAPEERRGGDASTPDPRKARDPAGARDHSASPAQTGQIADQVEVWDEEGGSPPNGIGATEAVPPSRDPEAAPPSRTIKR